MAGASADGPINATARTLKAFLATRRLPAPGMASSAGGVAQQVVSQTAAHFTDRGGLVLDEVNLRLIFWGSAWAGDTSPSASEVTDAAKKIFESPYMTGLAQYRGIRGGQLKGTIQVTDSDPPNPFVNADVANLVHRQLGKGLPEPDDDPLSLYCVILPPGVKGADPSVIGEHSYFVYFDITDLSLPPDLDIARAHYAWVSNDGTLDGITTILSHELVESCTDPNGDGIQGVEGTCSQGGWCEIGDVCGWSEVRNGVQVQAYWSEQAQTCIVPGEPDNAASAAAATTGQGVGGSPDGRSRDGEAVVATGSVVQASGPGTAGSPKGHWARPLSGASYTGGLIAAMWLAPIVAAIITIGTDVTPTLLPPWARLLSDSPALAGPVIAVIVWLVLGALYSPATSARNANATSFADLQARLTHLDAQLATLRAQGASTSAFQEAVGHCQAIRSELESAGPRWVTADGYVALWKRLHRAEEALLELEQAPMVLAEAAYDQWRLQNSNIQSGTALRANLGAAVQHLQASHQSGTSKSAKSPDSTAAPANEAPVITSNDEAKAVVRNVRFAINDFRDKRREALVRARNLLYGTMIMTELFAFAVLALAVIDHSPGTAIVAGVVFFLVGALVGLFNRLSQQAMAGTLVEDYSLAWVRLLLTPILSGLAAIGGVVLTGMLTLSGLTGLVQPGSSGGAASTVTLPVLADIFDLNKFRIGFLLALVFGGTPILISNRLQQLTDQYKNDLKSTEATSSTQTAQQSTH